MVWHPVWARGVGWFPWAYPQAWWLARGRLFGGPAGFRRTRGDRQALVAPPAVMLGFTPLWIAPSGSSPAVCCWLGAHGGFGLVRGAVTPIVTQGFGGRVWDCGAPSSPGGLVPRVQCVRLARSGHKPRGGGPRAISRWTPRDGHSVQREPELLPEVWCTVGCPAWTQPGQTQQHATPHRRHREEGPRSRRSRDDRLDQLGVCLCRGPQARTEGGPGAPGAP